MEGYVGDGMVKIKGSLKSCRISDQGKFQGEVYTVCGWTYKEPLECSFYVRGRAAPFLNLEHIKTLEELEDE